MQLELAGPDIVWSPELGDAANEAGVHGMLLSWVKSYFEIGTLMKRLDSGEGEGRRVVPQKRHVLQCPYLA